MKEISRDLNGFIEEGGWNFLQDSDSEQPAGSEKGSVGEEEEEDSEFDEEEAESEGGDSDFESEEESEEAEEFSEESASESLSEEEGMDWDALEEEAKRQDAKRVAKPKDIKTSTKKSRH